MLSKLNDTILSKINMITNHAIKKSNTFKGACELRLSLEGCTMHGQSHVDQQNLCHKRMNENDSKNTSACKEVKVKHVTGTTMLSSLIEAVNKLEALELLSVKLHEEEHAMKKHNVPAIMHDSQINLF